MTTIIPVELATLCRSLDDTEGLRKATANRLRILTLDTADSDGVERGFGLPDDHPVVVVQRTAYESLEASEAAFTKAIQQAMKASPLGSWIAAQKGVGYKQAARLLAATGDPYWHGVEDRPRTVSELWAFCGLVPGQKHRKGVQSNWSTEAKMRAWNISQSTLKAGGPWREVWDNRRLDTAMRAHSEPCPRCGPAGKPAQPGSPWSLGHAKADADRYVAKRLLREMWRESARIHAEGIPLAA